MKVTSVLCTIALLACPALAGTGPDQEAQVRETSEACVPFGGTIYGWHDTPTDSWYGVGDFTVGRQVLHATIVDPNTGFEDLGPVWIGTETAKFDFGGGDGIDLMTEFVCELDPAKLESPDFMLHVNEAGYFANGRGRFKNAWGRFSSQGPGGTGFKLPSRIVPGQNDGGFWIGQYVGSICGVQGAPHEAETKNE
ncbi:MAG: hypothetical protein ACYDBY_15495 [Thermoanaerobaculia bacterium]